MIKRTVYGLAWLLAAAGGASGGGGGTDYVVVHIRDVDMPVSNWAAFVAPNSAGGFSFAADQAPTGGTLGSYRSISHWSATGPASGLVLHAHRETWTPLVRGPIVYLHMTVDLNCFNGGTSGAVAFGFVVFQGDGVYYGPTYTALTGSGWRNDLRVLNMTADNFSSAASEHPDFGPGGGLIAFGFFSSNGTGISTPISSSSGVDNFFVTIGTVPPVFEGAPCGPSDIGAQGGVGGPDGVLDNNDFIVYIDAFFSGSGAADYGAQGGLAVPDGVLDNNDFVVFVDRFFDGCG